VAVFAKGETMTRYSVLKGALLVGLAATCVGMATAQRAEQRAPMAKVTGVLTFRENLEFLPGTRIEVAIRDASDSRTGMQPVGTVIIRDPKRVPIPFTVLYHTTDIDPSKEYLLHARVFVRRHVQYTSGPGVPVITLRNPVRDIQVPMNPVRAGPSTRIR
jgi:uncharacterized lipoprotein YbaY